MLGAVSVRRVTGQSWHAKLGHFHLNEVFKIMIMIIINKVEKTDLDSKEAGRVSETEVACKCKLHSPMGKKANG